MNRDRTSHGGRQVPDPEPTSHLVEWLAWSLQLAVGFLAGCGVGYEAARLVFIANLNDMLLVAVGGGLISGAFTSFYGNRAWMATSIFLAIEPTPPRKARACSLVVGGIGVTVVLLTLIRHLIAAGRRDHYSSSAGFDAFLLLAAVVPGFLLVHALRAGTGFWWFGIIEREETPLIFWVYVVLNGAGVLSILSMML
jgi:hypothetical protein